MEISKSDDGLTYFIRSRGFSYGDFNKAGKMDLWRIAKHFELSRVVGRILDFENDFQLGMRSPKATISVFLRYQTFKVFPEFFDAVGISSPWCMKFNVGYVGKSSYWIEARTSCEKTGQLFFQSTCQAIRVDAATRRPADLPEKGAAKYRASAPKSPPQVFVIPENVANKPRSFTLTTKALPSETDFNKHVNQSICFKYCYDTACLAAKKGQILTKFTQDLAYYNVKTFSVEYVGEMRAGDSIDIQCWEDETDHSVLYFIVRARDKVACRCKGEWYTDANGDLITRTRRMNSKFYSNL